MTKQEKLIINVEKEDLKRETKVRINNECYNAILSIVSVTHGTIQDTVDELLGFAIARTTIMSGNKTILDFSELYNVEKPKIKMKGE